MKKYIIEEKLLNGLLEYLSKKPYVEAYTIISHLSKLEQLQEDDTNLNNNK